LLERKIVVNQTCVIFGDDKMPHCRSARISSLISSTCRDSTFLDMCEFIIRLTTEIIYVVDL